MPSPVIFCHIILLLYRLGKLVSKLLIEPDPILPIDLQPIMWMTIRGGGVVDGERTGSSHCERAKNALVRVVKPNIPVAIHANAAGMRATGTTTERVEILADPLIRPWHCLCNLQFSNCRHEPCCPPDIPIVINGDQVRRQPATGRVAYLILQQRTTAGILTNEGDRRVVLGKPDIVVGINRDAIGHAVRGGCSNLREDMRGWIEATNFVRVLFGEPHFAMMINHDIPWESIERRD